ncbi:unnamed protein product [Clonostachys byssicola]|uniref:CENP-V/GFA domain-containing protein n=1 Tax=Clonostachys byssicola TaxID=160290 RepID=A0A9N9UIA9_9HYPO|nr:unnamed protein product [Clonostachys byssicola]
MATLAEGIPTLTGSCLCGSIKYQVTFPEESQWPPPSSACQCKMCRKFTASLIAQFLAIKIAMLTPEFSTFDTFREYESSVGVFRGFCIACGSSLSWRSLSFPDVVDIFIGTLDEKWLTENAYGTAKILATPNGFQAWLRHAIADVTNRLEGGVKYLGGATMEETL